MTDNQINFEYYTRNIHKFDFTKNEEGGYVDPLTEMAYRVFCSGVTVGGMGG